MLEIYSSATMPMRVPGCHWLVAGNVLMKEPIDCWYLTSIFGLRQGKNFGGTPTIAGISPGEAPNWLTFGDGMFTATLGVNVGADGSGVCIGCVAGHRNTWVGAG